MALIPRGVAYMLGSALAFSVMSVLVKLVGRHIPSQEIVFARSLVTLLVTIAMLRRAGLPLWGNEKRLLLLRGLLGFGALSAFFFSLTHLPIAEATVIQYTNPIFTALLATRFLKERTSSAVYGGAALSLIGVVLVTRPSPLLGGSASLDPLLVAVALGGALLSAAAYTTVRRLKKEHALTIVFYVPLVSTPLTIPVMAPVAVWPRGLQWLILCAVGLVTQVGQICLTKGISLEPAGRATSIGYTQILFSAAFGALIFGERPPLLAWCGASLIVSGTLLSVWRSRQADAERR